MDFVRAARNRHFSQSETNTAKNGRGKVAQLYFRKFSAGSVRHWLSTAVLSLYGRTEPFGLTHIVPPGLRIG